MKGRKMNRITTIAALAALAFAGCSDDEARRFGYKGADLEDSEPVYFTTSRGVTNYVPARVLMVCERYELTADELALAGAAGEIMPGEDLRAIPDGYAKDDEGPWFTYWTKPSERFGFKGVNGFLSHFNADKGVWETGQAYFSSYWPSQAEAKAALAALKEAVGAFRPKRFHVFQDSWVAEYVRLRVMAVVGEKPDGTWSCMLDVQDKNREGCGAWEPPDEQQVRLDQHNYAKALKEWKLRLPSIIEENHAAVENARAAAGLPAWPGDMKWEKTGDGRNIAIQFGSFEFNPPEDGAAALVDGIWAGKVAEVEKLSGAKFAGEKTVQEMDDGVVVFAAWKGGLYDVRLDMAFPTRQPKMPEEPLPEGAEPPQKAPGQFRVICIESMQPGFEIPPRPQPPKRK